MSDVRDWMNINQTPDNPWEKSDDYEAFLTYLGALNRPSFTKAVAHAPIRINVSELNNHPEFKEAAIAALRQWEAVSPLRFVIVDDAPYNPATDYMQVISPEVGETNEGTAFSSGRLVSVGQKFHDTENSPTGPGSYIFDTFIHEFGHEFGLNHPGLYNYSGPGGVQINYLNNATWIYDRQQYSVMSYFDGIDVGETTSWGATTPMIADIEAFTRRYFSTVTNGVRTYEDIQLNTGDDVYGFGSTKNGYTLTKTGETHDIGFTIHDTGGNDTIDFSGSTAGTVLDLRAGRFSSVNGHNHNVSIFAGHNADGTEYYIERGIGSRFADTILGNDGDNELIGGAGDDKLAGFAGNDKLDGGTGNDEVFGHAGDDLIIGGAGNDYLDGGEGADDLRAGAGDDKLFGGAGNDKLDGGAGSDEIDGGEGIDSLSYAASTAGVTADLTTGQGSEDTLTSIENLTGSKFNDIFTGNADANTLTGGAGDDRLSGLAGNDKLDGGAGNDQLDGGDGNDDLRGVDGDDKLVGGAGDDKLDGGVGNDQLDGGDGSDEIRGGDGNDIIIGGRDSLASRDINNTIPFANLEDKTESFDGDDKLYGGAGNDIIYGGQGNDLLDGGDGNDTFYGQDGVDIFRGGNGVDTVDFSKESPFQLLVNLQTNVANGGTATGDTFFSIENLIGSDDRIDRFIGNDSDNHFIGQGGGDNFNGGNGNDILDGGRDGDILFGDAGDDIIIGGAGQDALNGGAGIDTAIYTGSNAGVTIDLTTGRGSGGHAEGPVQIVGKGTLIQGEFITGIENVTGSAHADRLIGDNNANRLLGAEGDDTLVGGGGADHLDGGAGIDVVDFFNATSGVTANLATGQAGEDTLVSIENLSGSAFTDSLTGDAGANRLTGHGGNDTISGGDGNDKLYGDIETVPPTGVGMGSGNTVLAANAGNNSATTALDLTNSFALFQNNNIENSTVDPHTTVTATGNGQAGYYKVTLNKGAVLKLDIDGGSGFDSGVWILNAAGTQISYNDDASGDPGSTNGTDSRLTVTIPETGVYTIRVANYNNAGILNNNATYTLNISVPNFGGVSLIGVGGSDTLDGGAGDDVLDGGVGADHLIGGTGNDTFVVDDAGDVTVELAGEGTDAVNASISFNMGAQHLENLVLTGTADINGDGNSLDNTITGNVGANVLSGLGGNDTLNGGGGNDELDGGTGNDRLVGGTGDDIYWVHETGDTVVEVAGEGTDTINAFVNFALTRTTAIENLTLLGSADTSGSGNQLNNVITGNSGANLLVGLGGNDTFVFNTALSETNVDTIGDFVVADDTIGLDDAIFTALTLGQLTVDAFAANDDGAALDADDRIIYETDTGNIYYDFDGNGAGVSALIASIGTGHALTAADFIVV